eukprot:gene3687-6501_t
MSKIEHVDNFDTLKIKINTTCIKYKQKLKTTPHDEIEELLKLFQEESEKSLNKMSELQVHALNKTGKWEKSKFIPNQEYLELRKNQLLNCIQQIEEVMKMYKEKIKKIERNDLDELEDLSKETKEPYLKLDPYLEEIQDLNKDTEGKISGMMIESEIAKDHLNTINDEMQKQNIIFENQKSKMEDVNNKMMSKESDLDSVSSCNIQ